MSSSSWTAPLKRNWKLGIPQIAAFLRTAEGSVVSMAHDRASPDEQQLVIWLITGAHKMSPELRERLHAEWKALKHP